MISAFAVALALALSVVGGGGSAAPHPASVMPGGPTAPQAGASTATDTTSSTDSVMPGGPE